jgi:hypothetical protein
VISFPNHDPAQDVRYERHPVEDLEPQPESEITRLGVLLSTVLIWLTEGRVHDLTGLRHGQNGKRQSGKRRYYSPGKANLRLAAFIYALRPDLIGGSLKGVAERNGCTREAVRKHVEDFRKRFNFRTVGQWSPTARQHLSTAITAMHQRRDSNGQ